MSEAMEPTHSSHHALLLPATITNHFGTLTVRYYVPIRRRIRLHSLFPFIFNRQDDAAIGDYLIDQHRTVIVQQ
jgi:hypothetical protein